LVANHANFEKKFRESLLVTDASMHNEPGRTLLRASGRAYRSPIGVQLTKNSGSWRAELLMLRSDSRNCFSKFASFASRLLLFAHFSSPVAKADPSLRSG
jgi:hypothetical protein